jgi:hypothetical protein
MVLVFLIPGIKVGDEAKLRGLLEVLVLCLGGEAVSCELGWLGPLCEDVGKIRVFFVIRT